jgi:hypothetical protein
MKKRAFYMLVIIPIFFLFLTNGCKTSDTNVEDFSITITSGYSKKVTTVDPDDTGLTSVNFYVALRNHSDISGTITNWVFKIRHNIVTLLEINNNNYQDFNLVLSGETTLQPNNVTEIFVNTPNPFNENALPKEKLCFDPYTPSEVIVEVTITDNNGDIHTITAKGSYSYEVGTSSESKYHIIGEWELKRIVDGQAKAKQKIVFVGSKTSGRYAIYNTNTNEVRETGSYMVSNYMNLIFASDTGSQYWGEFKDENQIEGTLMIPEIEKENQKNQTGTWTAKKL